MHVCIEYSAQLRRAAGVAAETVDVPTGCTLLQLAQTLADRHGDELHRLLFNEGALHRSTLIFIDDVQTTPDPAVSLDEGQTVMFAAPISGG
jgi:molybdopterin converting factor small subunit